MSEMDHYTEHFRFVRVGGRDLAAVFHAAAGKRIVLFCHGFRGSKIGPNRFFVRLARRLQADGVCALRFDQYGSGDSEGDFFDSSFTEWVTTTTTLAERYLADGYRVALLGQSMGAAAVLAAAARLGTRLCSVVAWVPDPSIDAPVEEGNYAEEGGQRVGWRFWREAHSADIPRRFLEITAPTLVFFATEDEYVSADNRQALIDSRQPHQRIEILDGHTHSSWTYDQSEHVIVRSRDFLVTHLR